MTDAPVPSKTPGQQLSHALFRSWWITPLGVVLAAATFVFATYHVHVGVPPGLTARAQPTYSAQTQLLITSNRDPYLSASNVNTKIVALGNSAPARTGTGASTTAQAYAYDDSGGADGDIQRLVDIANSLPPRVSSDAVIHIRNRLYRPIAGTVTAVNPYAFSGYGGFRTGPLPYIQVTGTASSPRGAIDITNETAVAFERWFEAQQRTSRIPLASRVIVDQVNSADHAAAGGGTTPVVGIALAILVLTGTVGLALALGRRSPQPEPRPDTAAGFAGDTGVAVAEEPAMIIVAPADDEGRATKPKPRAPGARTGTPRRPAARARERAPNADGTT